MITPAADPGSARRSRIALGTFALADNEVSRMLAWPSLATGYFAGREQPSWASPASAARRDRARELGAQRGVSPTAIALACVLHQDARVMPVIGTVSADHLDEALAAAAIGLTPAEAAWLEHGDAA